MGSPTRAGPLWESVLKRLVIDQREKGNARLLQRIDQDSGGEDQEQSERSKDMHLCKADFRFTAHSAAPASHQGGL